MKIFPPDMKTLPSKYVSDIAYALSGGLLVALFLVTCMSTEDPRIVLLVLVILSSAIGLYAAATAKPLDDKLDVWYIKRHTAEIIEAIEIGTVSECNISGKVVVEGYGEKFELDNQPIFFHVGQRVKVHLLDYIDKDGWTIYRRAISLEPFKSPVK